MKSARAENAEGSQRSPPVAPAAKSSMPSADISSRNNGTHVRSGFPDTSSDRSAAIDSAGMTAPSPRMHASASTRASSSRLHRVSPRRRSFGNSAARRSAKCAWSSRMLSKVRLVSAEDLRVPGTDALRRSIELRCNSFSPPPCIARRSMQSQSSDKLTDALSTIRSSPSAGANDSSRMQRWSACNRTGSASGWQISTCRTFRSAGERSTASTASLRGGATSRALRMNSRANDVCAATHIHCGSEASVTTKCRVPERTLVAARHSAVGKGQQQPSGLTVTAVSIATDPFAPGASDVANKPRDVGCGSARINASSTRGGS
mmetsp:Transcript_32169/g.99631  ORF Transcript_32169/g.99631 Transcript_32169/m.99631 type:complete len:319 (+) Transcript_32169:596-1552(+)